MIEILSIILLIMVGVYIIGQNLIAFYFKCKEEFVERIQAKVLGVINATRE